MKRKYIGKPNMRFVNPETNMNLARKEMLNDVPIIRKINKEQAMDNTSNIDRLNKAIHFSIDSRYKKLQRKKKVQKIPIMFNLNVDDIEVEKNRVGLDIVIVIDVSASMSGKKIKLVKDTLYFIVDELQDIDRLSLVKFNSQSDIILGLTPMIPENKEIVKEIIGTKINACRATNIKEGLNDAFDILTNRKEINELTSIFFLSDGADTCGNNFKSLMINLQSYDQRMINKNMDYKINAFGYGNDHDEEVLCGLSEHRNGNFFYIKDLKLVDECFIECLGNMMTTFSNNVTVDVFLANGITFTKRYGLAWDKENASNRAKINIGSIYTEMKKNYLAEIQIPSIDGNDGVFKIAAVIFNYYIKGKQFTETMEFKLDLTNSNDLGTINSELEENLNRVKASELLKEVEQDCNNNNIHIAKQKVVEFRLNTMAQSNLRKSYLDNMCLMLDEEKIKNPKYTRQVRHMASEQVYRPGYGNIVHLKCSNKAMKKRKKC